MAGAARRISAIVAIVAPVTATAITVVVLIGHPLLIVAAVVCQVVGIGAAAYALTRTGARRTAGLALAVLALITPIALVVVFGQLLQLIIVALLLLIAVGATRRALGGDLAALTGDAARDVPVGPAQRPILIMNPKSGGGKVDRFRLVEEARRRGIEPVVLAPGDDLLGLAEQAVARGADVIGMAGGDGSQALVAGVAMRHGIGFVCVPAGTRNHLAMDLGLDRRDVGAALDAFGTAIERRIDLALIGEDVFVNNATMGLYAKIVQSPEYRNRKIGTAVDMLPGMLGPHAAPFDLQFVGPDGVERSSAHLILVSNNQYELSGDGFGSRRRIDAGALGIVAATFRSSADLARFVQMNPVARRRFPGWSEWTDTSFEVRSAGPVEVGVDGEAIVLDPPIRFHIAPQALRVRIPHSAPGYSPAAAAPIPGWSTVTALLRTAAGRPARPPSIGSRPRS
jgi:diacylglycerol kinase family enzyme